MTKLQTTLFALLFAFPAAADIATTVPESDIAEKERTTLGLYLTSAEAGAALAADPGIMFIDVRDPIEVMFVGHPDPVDAIVPFMFATYQYNEARKGYGMKPNPDFVAQVSAAMARLGLGKDAPVFVSCQTGGRTARAVNALAKAGYSQVYALFEGIEGDLNPETGRRDLNGWKNAGLPWSYPLSSEVAWHPPH